MLHLPSFMGGPGYGARGLLRRADSMLSRELKSVRTAEIGVSSFTFGLLQGRFKSQGGLTLLGLPADLLAGLVMHAAPLLGIGKAYAHHLHAVGDGALASFATTTGYRVGERWGGGGSFVKSLSSGMLGDKEPAGGSTLADAEINRLVRS